MGTNPNILRYKHAVIVDLCLKRCLKAFVGTLHVSHVAPAFTLNEMNGKLRYVSMIPKRKLVVCISCYLRQIEGE